MSDLGLKGQSKFKKARVLVAGVGGLGSQISAQLASMGIGFIRIIDRDIVEVSNLQRQHLYSIDQIGSPKVEAAKTRLGRMNPYIEIEAIPSSINSNTAPKIVEDVDIVLDGLDSLKPRLALNRACIDANTPYIFGAAITHVGSVSTIIPNKTPCLECWQGGVDESKIPTCATVGVTPSIISLVASVQVSEAVKLILGKKAKLAGKLLYCDLNDLSFDQLDLARSKECPSCGERKTEIEPVEAVEEICGRNGNRVFIITPSNEVTVDLKKTIKQMEKLELIPLYQGEFGVTFRYKKENDGYARGSLFQTGVFVLESTGSKEQAIILFERLTGLKLNTD